MGVKQVPFVGVHGNLILAKHAMVSQLGHPIFEQLLRFHLERFHQHGIHTFNVVIVIEKSHKGVHKLPLGEKCYPPYPGRCTLPSS